MVLALGRLPAIASDNGQLAGWPWHRETEWQQAVEAIPSVLASFGEHRAGGRRAMHACDDALDNPTGRRDHLAIRSLWNARWSPMLLATEMDPMGLASDMQTPSRHRYRPPIPLDSER